MTNIITANSAGNCNNIRKTCESIFKTKMKLLAPYFFTYPMPLIL